MTDTEKYYRPELSEFHVGFEYERCDDGYAYFKDTFPMAIDLSVFYEHYQRFAPYIRVKFLDHDDILECGWNKVTQNEYGMPLGDVLVILTLADKGIKIEATASVKAFAMGESDKLFDGTILNKSELKFQMARLGIKQ